MFLRVKTSPSGQCLQLLESYRNAQGKPSHRVVVSLGDAKIAEADRAMVARMVSQRLYGQEELFPQTKRTEILSWVDRIAKRIEREGRWKPVVESAAPAAPAAPEAQGLVIDGVLADQVTHTHTTPLGPSLLGWEAWKRLEMNKMLESLGFNPAQVQAAAVSVINRLVDPGSELALVDWLPDSSLPELMGMEMTQAGKDRFYRVSDLLMKHRLAIEAHLRDMQGKLFSVDRTVLLYDLTNSYFEGEALGNPKAKRGKSKEKRNDCPQVVLGMVFDRRSFELAHRVFEGNLSDGKSLVHMIEEMEKLAPGGQLPEAGKHSMVLLDGGIATQANLALLREKAIRYLVNDSRKGRKTYHKEFAEQEQFVAIENRENKSGVKVRKLADPLWKPQELSSEGKEQEQEAKGKTNTPSQPDTLVLCWSEGREKKETAIRSSAEVKYLAALEKLGQRVGKGKLKDKTKIHLAIGRLQSQHSRIQRFYQVELKEETGGLRLAWSRKDAPYEANDDLMGCYVLRTNAGEDSAQDIWNLYMSLSKAEEGFRSLKGDLGLRPNYHQLENRVDGHIWITILAYHLLSWIRETLRDQGDHRSWGTVRRLMQTHCYTTIVLPTKGGQLYRIRKAGEPDELQKVIYQRLNVNWKQLPQTKIAAETGATL
jgi:transposase